MGTNNGGTLPTNYLGLMNEDRAKIKKAINTIGAVIDSKGNVSSYMSGMPPTEIIKELRLKTRVGIVVEI